MEPVIIERNVKTRCFGTGSLRYEATRQVGVSPKTRNGRNR